MKLLYRLMPDKVWRLIQVLEKQEQTDQAVKNCEEFPEWFKICEPKTVFFLGERRVRSVKVSYNIATREWIVKAFDELGVRWPEADCYDTDKASAEATAKRMVQ